MRYLMTAMLLAASVVTAKAQTLTIQDYPGDGNILAKIAATKFCEPMGIKCNLTTAAANGPLSIRAMIAGDIDIAFAPPESAFLAIDNGAMGFKAIAGGNTTLVHLLAAPKGTGLKGKPISDIIRYFEGKIIASAPGTPDVLLNHLALTYGVDPSRIFKATGGVPPSRGISLLVGRNADAILTYEPGGAMCELMGGCEVLWRAKDSGPEDLMATNGANVLHWAMNYTIERKQDAILKFQKALILAEEYLKDPRHKDEILDLVMPFVKEPNISKEAVAKGMEVMNPTRSAYFKVPALFAMESYMSKNKMLKKRLDPTAFIWDKALVQR